jgi:hypothetical protein
MTIHTRHRNSAKPDKDQSAARAITAVALCMMVALPSGSAIGQSQIVPFHFGSCDWSIRCQPRPTRGDMGIRVGCRRTDKRYQGRSLRPRSKGFYYSLR